MSRQPKATRQRNAESSELRNYTDSFVNFPSTFWDNVSSFRFAPSMSEQTWAAIGRGLRRCTKMCRPIPQ